MVVKNGDPSCITSMKPVRLLAEKSCYNMNTNMNIFAGKASYIGIVLWKPVPSAMLVSLNGVI
jgi:hypothetical protein